MSKRIVLSLLALLLAACLLCSVLLIAAAALVFAEGGLQLQSSNEPLVQVEMLVEDHPGISNSDYERMIATQIDVVRMRGLQPLFGLERHQIGRDELGEMVINDFFVDYTAEDAGEDVAVLSAMGMVEPGFDLYQLYVDLYTEQIAGFYDPATKEMYVVGDEGFGAIERLTYAHEYVHVLQDQHYDLNNGMGMDDETCEADPEYCTAVQALIEGDASLVQTWWFLENSTQQEQLAVQEFYATYSSPVLDSSPLYMQDMLQFPYMQGMEFVNTLYDLGGWEMVDAAYANPPVSTEQILHPDRYPLDVPADVALPDIAALLDGTWQKIDDSMMGEYASYLLLARGWMSETRQSEAAARAAVDGWSGDHYAVYLQPESGSSIYLQRWQWDDKSESREFWKTFKDYAVARWGEPFEQGNLYAWHSAVDGAVLAQMVNNQVFWVMAPDEDLAQTLLNKIIE